MYYENQFLHVKSSSNIDINDVLLFRQFDKETQIIPSFIKVISQSSFEHNEKIKSLNLRILKFEIKNC